MQGRVRVGKRVARMTVRIEAPSGAVVTDVMLQPGGAASGWLPHVTELPWTAGIVAGGATVDQDALERLAQLEQLTLVQADILQQLGLKVEDLAGTGGGIDQEAIYQAFVQARGGV